MEGQVVSRSAALDLAVVVELAVMVELMVVGCLEQFVCTVDSYKPDPSDP